MNLKQFGRWLQAVVICCFCVACQQLPDDVLEASEEGTLHVKTRSATDEELIYPLNLYAFTTDGDCAASQIVNDKEETVKLSLPAGKYKVVAIAGYSDDYKIPSEPVLDDMVQMEGNSGAGTALMMGKADVTVGADKESKLEMTLSYVVTSIDLVLSNLPSDVAKVSVALSSFYSSMNMKGEYVDTDYTMNFDCSLNTENKWLAKTRYVFPGSGSKVALSITLKLKNEEELIYGYIWNDTPEAGQPYHLQGEYSDGFSLTGSFVVTGWNEAENVKFNFGNTSSSDDEMEEDGGEGKPGSDLSGVPEIGDVYNGTLVLEVGEADETGVDVLLMSLDEWYALTSNIEELLAEYSVNGISGWRLPTYDEAKWLKDTYGGDELEILNGFIEAFNSALVKLDIEERYLCMKSDVYYSFSFQDGKNRAKAGVNTTYSVRLLKSYRIEF